MDNLYIDKGKSTPLINFDYDSGKLIFSGESFPENSVKFYEPVLNWIDEYFRSCGEKETVFEFNIIYFNSSTSKIFMMLFSSLDELAARGKKIRIDWQASAENNTAIECGKEFKEDVTKVDFNIITV